jgi:hypothetical protein
MFSLHPTWGLASLTEAQRMAMDMDMDMDMARRERIVRGMCKTLSRDIMLHHHVLVLRGKEAVTLQSFLSNAVL